MRPKLPKHQATGINLIYTILLLTTLPNPTTALDQTVIVTITQAATTKVTQTATATPQVPQDPSYTSLSLFKSSVLDTTNAYRTVHNASSLTWNDTLAGFAKDWAETCWWKHSGGPYGENLAYGYTNSTAAVAAWGDEASLYDFTKPTGFTEATGHFTQLVWKGTREVGCAAVDCGLTDLHADKDKNEGGAKRAQGWYVVCEYVPGGNVIGAGDSLEYFRVNVQEGEGDVDLDDSDGGDEDEEENEDEDSDGDKNGDTGNNDSGGLTQDEIIQMIIRGDGVGSSMWSARDVGWWAGIVYILSTV